MILIAGAVLAVRWLLFYLLRDPYWLLPVQVLHAFTFIIIFFAISNYINRNVPKELKASGQALYGLAIGGVARVVGALAGGYLAQWRGLRSAFLYCSLLVTAATAAFGAWTLTAGTRRARSGVNAGT
jgi:PPP family 3-phenylpropionic acid transporter